MKLVEMCSSITIEKIINFELQTDFRAAKKKLTVSFRNSFIYKAQGAGTLCYQQRQ